MLNKDTSNIEQLDEKELAALFSENREKYEKLYTKLKSENDKNKADFISRLHAQLKEVNSNI